MRKIAKIILLFLIVSLQSKGQKIPLLDSILFNKINNYRAENRVYTLSKSTACYVEGGLISTSINNIKTNFDSLYFNASDSNQDIEPNVYEGSYGAYLIEYFIIQGKFDKTDFDKVADTILEGYIEFEKINKIILLPALNVGACATTARIIHINKIKDNKPIWYITAVIGINIKE